MLELWKSTLRVDCKKVKLLVSGYRQGDILKACLPASPQHPRAVLTLLEGLALWNGRRLSVAISVDETYLHYGESSLFGEGLWPVESPLVNFEMVQKGRKKHHIRGVGDFRSLRMQARGVWT